MLTSLSDESPLELGGGGGSCDADGVVDVGDASERGALLVSGGGGGGCPCPWGTVMRGPAG